MYFNSLDLLASAAQLQQKGDDAPERLLNIQQCTNSQLLQQLTMGQKGNFSLVKSKNSTNSFVKGKPSIVIVKKSKLGSNLELEKMLDEYNYGNAKQGSNQCVSVNINTCTNGNLTNKSGSVNTNTCKNSNLTNEGGSVNTNTCTIINNLGKGVKDRNTCTNINCPEEKTKSQSNVACHFVTHASSNEGQTKDSNTVITRPTSQLSESAHVLCVGKCKVCVNTCTGRFSLTSGTCNTDLHKCSLCDLVQCDCQKPSSKFEGTGNIKLNDLSCGNECVTPGNLLSDCKHLVHQTSEVEEGQFKLDDRTGEFVTATSPKVNVNISQKQDNSFCTGLNGDCMYNSFKEKISGPLQSLGTDVISGNQVSVTHVLSEAVSAHVHFETNINSRPKFLSKQIQMPYVKVVSSEVSGDSVVEKPATSVISKMDYDNQSVSYDDISEKSHTETGGNVSQGVENALMELKSVEKRYLALDSEDPVFIFFSTNASVTTKCNSASMVKMSESCTSLEEFDIIYSQSLPSIHLLSPDWRNPDSVGIAESPISPPNFENDEENEIILCSSVSNNHISDVGAVINKMSETTPNEDSVSCPSEFNLESPEVQTIPEVKEFKNELRFVFPKKEMCNDIASDFSQPDNSQPNSQNAIFGFESDHCYAGLPEKFTAVKITSQNDGSFHSEDEEMQTPLSFTCKLSSDSEHKVSCSPSTEPIKILQDELYVESAVNKILPVLVGGNSAGCLPVHDTNFASALGGPVLALSDSLPTLKPGINLITGTKLTPVSQPPVYLSPVGKTTSPIFCEVPKSLQETRDSIGFISPHDENLQSFLTAKPERFSPLKIGKFRIGTFASFSNTGMVDESQKKNDSSSSKNLLEDIVKKEPELITKCMSADRRPSAAVSGKTFPAIMDHTLGSLVQKVKSNLSPTYNRNGNVTDHIQHDHDYCTKKIMPLVVSNFLEARLLNKGGMKIKHSQSKSKRIEGGKAESKSGKHKKHLTSKDDEFIDEMNCESDNQSLSDSFKGTFKRDKFCEPKRRKPKVKITGSSDFQDQFVYFVNTKKRLRRWESKDSPLPYPTDHFIPPKPSDIIVPHLTDSDIDNLKLHSRQSIQPPLTAGCNSLKNEFMAAKLLNTPFPVHPHLEMCTVDDEKNIINTILSIENDNLASPASPDPPAFTDSMELCGQGLGGDFMSLLTEQMNLTQEQMDLLYSAVDELQNSSPEMIVAEKLDLTNTSQIPPVSGNMAVSSDVEIGNDGDETLLETSCNKAQMEQDIIKYPKETVICQPPKSVELNNLNKPDKIGSKTTEEIKDIPLSESHIIAAVETNKPVSENKTSENTEDTKKLDSTSCVSNSVRTETDSFAISPNILYEIPHGVEFPSSEKCTSVPVFQTCSRHLTPERGSLNSSNYSITSDISLPQPDTSLKLLGTEFNRLDKGDVMFTESFLQVNQNVLGSLNSVQNSMDYNAPWIVTVSMYWNDLPAIMINNRPYVRLVDIHKQILPAKDTGILKKRCQLMGIDVENCSEMQRYFLVQYGKAINSKSSLIITKENAAELIGYYVDPQPKSSVHVENHKSIIDHRREQLRKIAIARHATLKAQLLAEKEKQDPRIVTEPSSPEEQSNLQPVSTPVIRKKSPVPKVQQQYVSKTREVIAVRSPRSTRHKKINFLEMLCGDSSGNDEEFHDGYCTNNKNSNKSVPGEVKNRKLKKLKKMKLNYTEMENSEDTESVESEYFSTYESESTTNESVFVSKQARQMKVSPAILKTKAKSNKANILGNKNFSRKGLPKMKVVGVKSRPNTNSVPEVKVVDKLVDAVPIGLQLFEHHLSLPKAISPEHKRYNSSSPPINVERLHIPDSIGAFGEDIDEIKPEAILQVVVHEGSIYSNHSNGCLVNSNSVRNLEDVQMLEADMKVPPTLPDAILQSSDTDSVNSHLNNSTTITIAEEGESDTVKDQSEQICHVHNKEVNGLEIESNEQQASGGVNSSEGTNANDGIMNVACVSRKDSVVISDTKTSLVMKRKEVVQVCNDEIPLRIIHRDSNTQTEPRRRAQLGEIFVDHYHNKTSHCVRCYTCRKIMSVDNFMRHLHDIVSGGLLPVINSRTLETGDSEMTESERKLWVKFQRKRELFDNNQLPSPEGLIFEMDGKYNEISLLNNTSTAEIPLKQSGPRIITTPISPKRKLNAVPNKHLVTHTDTIFNQSCAKQSVKESNDGVRTSSRKRKIKRLYPFEKYSFTKYPHLMKSTGSDTENNQ